jgi:acyl carrier protein
MAGKRLVAYIVSPNQQACTTSELRNFLKQKLPEHMIPSAFVLLDALPLSPNGKVDRKALPAPDQNRAGPEESYVAPGTPVEEVLAEIWVEVLKLDKVGIHDNFFELGGHSLLATQVMSRLRELFQVELPLRSLFESPTVAGLAERIEQSHRKEQGVESLLMLPISREKDLPLSFAQERLWFLDQFEPNSSVYNIPSALRLRGSLNIGALEQSLNEIIGRHESLRTTFSTIDGEAVQVIAPSVEFSLAVVDLRHRPEREEEAQRLVLEEARLPFDLAQGPLFRSKLLRLGEDDHVLLLTAHHIVSDGWSMGVLHHELSVLYEAFSRSQRFRLPELPIQYADYAVWQREWLRGDELDGQLSYWKKQLKGIPGVLNLPMDRPRSAVANQRGVRHYFVLPKKLSEELKALSRKESVTLYMTLLAAIKAMLYQYSGQSDLVIGSPIAGRNRPEIEALIGFFVNTLVLRTDLSGNPTFREILRRVRDVCLAAYAHQELPYQKLVEALQPKRERSRGSLAQVFFAFQNVPRQPLTIPGVTVTPVRTNLVDAKGALTVFMWEAEECLAGSFNYAADLFNAATISRMNEYFQTLLNGVVADPERRLFDLPALLDQSRSELLEAVQWATEQSWHFEIDTTAGREQGEI